MQLRVRQNGKLPSRTAGLFGRQGVFGPAESTCLLVSNQTTNEAFIGFFVTKKAESSAVSTLIDKSHKLPHNEQQKYQRPKYPGVLSSGDREMIVILYDQAYNPISILRKSIAGADSQFTIYPDRIVSVKAPVDCSGISYSNNSKPGKEFVEPAPPAPKPGKNAGHHPMPIFYRRPQPRY